MAAYGPLMKSLDRRGASPASNTSKRYAARTQTPNCHLHTVGPRQRTTLHHAQPHNTIIAPQCYWAQTCSWPQRPTHRTCSECILPNTHSHHHVCRLATSSGNVNHSPSAAEGRGAHRVLFPRWEADQTANHTARYTTSTRL